MTEKVWPAEKTHVAPESAILVEENRVIGDASVEAPVYASRGVRINGVENYLTRQWARPLLRMLGRVAAADSGAPLIPPGQMSLAT